MSLVDVFCRHRVVPEFERGERRGVRCPALVMTSCSRRSDGLDFTFGDADVGIGDVKTMLFDVFQTLVGIDPRPCLSIPAQFDRLKERPRRKLRG